MSALCHISLFDHQIGAAKQRKRDGNAEGLGGFQINDQVDLGGLLNWKIGRLLSLENPAGVILRADGKAPRNRLRSS